MHDNALSILVVDDDEPIFKTVSRALRGEGYQLSYAPSAEDALRVLETERFQIVISDNRMPGMSGVEFLELVRARHAGMVRVMMSSDERSNAITEAVERGTIFRLLPKPWEQEKLKATVRFAVQYWRELAVEASLLG